MRCPLQLEGSLSRLYPVEASRTWAGEGRAVGYVQLSKNTSQCVGMQRSSTISPLLTGDEVEENNIIDSRLRTSLPKPSEREIPKYKRLASGSYPSFVSSLDFFLLLAGPGCEPGQRQNRICNSLFQVIKMLAWPVYSNGDQMVISRDDAARFTNWTSMSQAGRSNLNAITKGTETQINTYNNLIPNKRLHALPTRGMQIREQWRSSWQLHLGTVQEI